VLFDLAMQVHNWRKLQDPQIGGNADPDTILELCRKAGFSEEESQKAAAKRANDRLDDQQPVFNTTYVHQ